MEEGKILIVEDKEVNRAILRDMFKDKYEVIEAENGKIAIDIISKKWNELSVILLDIMMPVLDGFGVLEELKQKNLLFYIPVIMITGDVSQETEVKGYEMGVSDIIKKPFNPHIVKKRVDNTIELYRHKNQLESMVEEQTAILLDQAQKLKEANEQIIDTMSTVVEFRNLESGQHVNRIKAFTKALAESIAKFCPEYSLTKEKIEIITSASALHDVGKIVIPDSILLKPAKLTPDEYEIMKSHTTKGCEIIDRINGLYEGEYRSYGYDICRYHHERYDGGGYPEGLKGDEIPISAQIVSVADVYDALVSERVYKAAYSKDKAYQMIVKGECGVFAPKLMECFKKTRDKLEELADSFV